MATEREAQIVSTVEAYGGNKLAAAEKLQVTVNRVNAVLRRKAAEARQAAE